MNATATQVWAAATLILVVMAAVQFQMIGLHEDLMKEIRKHDRTDYIQGYWKGGDLYLSHEDFEKFDKHFYGLGDHRYKIKEFK